MKGNLGFLSNLPFPMELVNNQYCIKYNFINILVGTGIKPVPPNNKKPVPPNNKKPVSWAQEGSKGNLGFLS